jgi:hypothetical protein
VSELPHVVEVAIQLEVLEGVRLTPVQLLDLAKGDTKVLLTAIPVAEEQKLQWQGAVYQANDPDEFAVCAGESASWEDLATRLRQALQLAVGIFQ